MRRRICRALDLVNDASLIAEYERRHAAGAVWPAVIEHLRATGILEMEIWRASDRLFMIVELEEEGRPRAEEPTEVTRWESEMSRFQRPLPGADPDKWMPMTRIFSLDEQ